MKAFVDEGAMPTGNPRCGGADLQLRQFTQVHALHILINACDIYDDIMAFHTTADDYEIHDSSAGTTFILQYVYRSVKNSHIKNFNMTALHILSNACDMVGPPTTTRQKKF
jgi:hypothetical protein